MNCPIPYELFFQVSKELFNGLIVCDAEEKILYVNNNICEVSEYSESELLGKTPRIFQGENTSIVNRNKIHEAIMKREPIYITVLNYSKTGKEYYMDLHINFIKHNGKEYFIGFQKDVTEREKLRDQLQEESSKVQESLRTKLNFLSFASHDLRTPLNAIMGFAEAIKYLPEKRDEYIDDILESGNRLLSLIDSILNSSGYLPVKKGYHNIDSIVEKVLKFFPNKIVYRKPRNQIGFIFDQSLAQRALENIINNAVKHGTGQYVFVQIKETSSRVSIEVTNKGYIQNTDFLDIDIRDPHISGSTGFGMLIVKTIMKSHGGDFFIENREDKVIATLHFPKTVL